MSKSIETLLDALLAREGGFVNHPADKGGPTKYGIRQATLSAWLGRSASVDEVRSLDVETAKAIYRQRYYAGPGIDRLPAEIREQVFDMGVNHGPRIAVKLLQEVLNLAGFGPIDEDGALGPETYGAAERAQAQMGPFLTNALVEQRIALYRAIVDRDPSQAAFLAGWLARAGQFRVTTTESG